MSMSMSMRLFLLAVPVAACTGCGAANFFAVANNVTGTIINLGIIFGAGGILANLGNITQLIQGLVGG